MTAIEEIVIPLKDVITSNILEETLKSLSGIVTQQIKSDCVILSYANETATIPEVSHE